MPNLQKIVKVTAAVTLVMAGVSWSEVPKEKTDESPLGSAHSQVPDSVHTENVSSIEYNREKELIHLTGNPRLSLTTDTGVEVFSESADMDLKNQKFILNGDLIIFQGDSITKGTSAEFFWETDEFVTQGIQSKTKGIILRSKNFAYRKDEKGTTYLEGLNASVTTEDTKEPSTWISAKRIRLYPGDRLTFTGLTMRYKDIPFFYVPYFSHSLNPKVGYLPMPGMRSYWGPYLLNNYGFLFGNKRVENYVPTADYLGTAHLDYRARRGLGLGLDVENIAKNELSSDLTGLSLYFIHDIGSDITVSDESRSNVDPNRWRIALQQMWPIYKSHGLQWSIKANINALSDEYMLRDFYPDIFQNNSTPDNTVAIMGTGKQSLTMLLQRFVPNDFYVADQRTELSYDQIRSTLLKTPVVYESQNSFAFMRQFVPATMRTKVLSMLDNYRDGVDQYSREYWNQLLNTDAFARLHSFHEFSYAQKIAGFLNVTPKLGGGYTGYYNPGQQASLNQAVFFAGADVDFKFSRRYNTVKNDFWGLKGLNHIIQPHFTLAYFDVSHENTLFPAIDGNSPTTNPSALSLGRYTQFDSITTSCILRYGLKNILMTNRDEGSSWRWFSWDVFMDSYLYDPKENRDFSNLYSIMKWDPLPWMSYTSEMQFPVIGEDKEWGCKEFNNYITFMPHRSVDVFVGHRYLKQHMIVEDGSQLDLRLLYRLNENTALSASWRWELFQNKLDIQEYNLYRNMGSWYLGMSVFMRQNGGRNEFGAGFSFTIKETGSYLPLKFF